MHIFANKKQRDLSVWLRTGRWPRNGLEFKFNPWHDPVNGRFTFAGTGRYFGRGGTRLAGSWGQDSSKIEYVDDPDKPPIASMEEADAWRAEELAKHGDDPRYVEAIEARYRLYRSAFAPRPHAQSSEIRSLSRSERNFGLPLRRDARSSARDGFGGGGGGFGGGGVSGGWENSSPMQAQVRMEAAPLQRSELTSERLVSRVEQLATQRLPQSDSDRWRQVSRNGYLYEIDAQDRTRRVSGELTFNPDQTRSRAVQRAAGGSDRRAGDHGGHYIARRFDGPTEAFNHFAQDANFNRGDYRRLEEQWARAVRTGKNVRVKIAPAYDRASQRPSALNIWFWIDGELESLQFSNEPKDAIDAE